MKTTTGIMDWGIGGLSVYRALRARGLTTDIFYFSDSGTTPYGKLSREKLRERFLENAPHFRERRIHHVLVACHAASSALDPDLHSGVESIGGVSFRGIIPAAVRTVRQSRASHLGVIGGEFTIGSGIYRRALAGLGQHLSFCPAQPLSAFVEAGDLASPAVETAVRRVLEKLPSINALLLACTHYPALSPLFAKVSPGLELLDPGAAMAESVSEDGANLFAFLTTGDPHASARAARLAFGIDLETGAKIAGS